MEKPLSNPQDIPLSMTLEKESATNVKRKAKVDQTCHRPLVDAKYALGDLLIKIEKCPVDMHSDTHFLHLGPNPFFAILKSRNPNPSYNRPFLDLV